MKKIWKWIWIFSILMIGLAACTSSPNSGADQPAIDQAVESVDQQPAEEPVELSVDPTPTEAANPPAAPVQSEAAPDQAETANLTYPIVDSDQGNCYGESAAINCPAAGESFYGQDAQYQGNLPSYTDNGDGTVTDNVTGLMWQKSPGEKMTYAQAAAGAEAFSLAGYDDWRLPTIKELYSLIQFDGVDPSGPVAASLIPFIDTHYFDFEYGDEAAGERIIDSQWATSSLYTSTTMNGAETMFGVNFADGRIKGYPTSANGPGGTKTYFVIYVRGNPAYGVNDFVDNGDGTVSDLATGLTWTQADSGSGMNWEAALNYCETLTYAGADNWRLPNVKELQSLVDYSRSPDATNSAALDPVFQISTITNEAGQVDYPAFWSSTTHANLVGGNGAYVSFGRSMGYLNGQWVDVHGAGAQRSDPKTGSAADYPTGHGPQGDAIRVDNYVRCVTDSSTQLNPGGSASTENAGANDFESDSSAASITPGAPGDRPAPGENQAGQQGAPQVDLATAAATLGISEETLRAALGSPPPDLAAAATQLGITQQALMAALGLPAPDQP